MAGSDVITIPVHLPRAEATALASVLKRMDPAVVHNFASPTISNSGQPEGDLAWSGITALLGALSCHSAR